MGDIQDSQGEGQEGGQELCLEIAGQGEPCLFYHGRCLCQPGEPAKGSKRQDHWVGSLEVQGLLCRVCNPIGDFCEAQEQAVGKGRFYGQQHRHLCQYGKHDDIAAKLRQGFKTVHYAGIYDLKAHGCGLFLGSLQGRGKMAPSVLEHIKGKGRGI